MKHAQSNLGAAKNFTLFSLHLHPRSYRSQSAPKNPLPPSVSFESEVQTARVLFVSCASSPYPASIRILILFYSISTARLAAGDSFPETFCRSFSLPSRSTTLVVKPAATCGRFLQGTLAF